MTLTLNVQLSVIRRGPLNVSAFASRSTVVGNQGVVFWLDGPDLKRIGAEEYEVEWVMNDTRDLAVFPILQTIWPTEYTRALRAIGGLTMGRYRGPICGHCFGGPAGTYQVTCIIKNRAGVAQTILAATITKQDADAVYPGTSTVCYSRSGNFTGAPAGAQLITVSDGIITRGTGASANTRVLMRSGETFAPSIAPRDSNGMYVGTFGGTAPAILTTGFVLNAGAGPHTNMVFDNLSLDLGYNPAGANDWWNIVPTPTAPMNGFQFISGTISGMTLHRVYVKGAFIGIYIIGTDNVIFDCGVTDYFDFGMFGLRDRTAVVGSFSAQNPAAQNVNMTAGGVAVPANRATWNTTVEGDTAAAQLAFPYFGPLGQAPNWPRHGPLRYTACDAQCIIRSAMMNSAPGWSGHPQASVRWAREEIVGAQSYYNMTDTFLHGGTRPLSVSASDVTQTVPSKFILVDGVTMEVDAGAWAFIEAFVGNVWVRNCLMFMPSDATLVTPQPALSWVDSGGAAGGRGDGFFIENCTVVLQGNFSTKNLAFGSTVNGGPLTYQNNLQIRTATNVGSVSIPAGSIEVTSMTDFNADFSPTPANTTVNGRARGIAPVVDFDGVTRGTPGAAGALEPK